MIKKLMKRMPGARYFSRFKIASRYFVVDLRLASKWIFSSQEDSNFYYNISHLNRDQMLQATALVLKCDPGVVQNYFVELETDEELIRQINSILRNSTQNKIDENIFGRRIIWYAIARHTKPRLIVETGVADGLGSCVLARAIQANEKEGFIGAYLGTDIDEQAGRLFLEFYSNSGKIVYGDSIQSLLEITEHVDLFINDSDHSENYELREYEAIFPKLSANAWILGDNSHVTSTLSEFSLLHNRPFLFVKEEPAGHWYPGAGVGISIPK